MNASTTNKAKATNTHRSDTTTAASTSTGETKSSAPSPTTPTITESAVAKVSANSPHQIKPSFTTSTGPTALPSQAVVDPVPSLRSSNVQLKWKWIPVQIETSKEIWIFLHPIDKNHQVRVCASPSTEMPSLLVQPELISLEYKKQHGISRRRGHLERHWIRIYSYLQPLFPQRIGMRCLCRLFDAVERLTTENYSRHSTLMLMPIPSGVWTSFPHASHDTLEGLVEWVNEVVEVSSEDAPQLLFLQEGAPDEEDGEDEYKSLSGACVVVDETGCFRLAGDNVTDDNVVRVTREYSNLQSLDLACCYITDASVMEVARGCSNLQTLDLTNCDNITDASVMEVATRCSNLQTLNLEWCDNITDASVMEVASRCSNLQTLILGGCNNITDASVMEVARRCSNLQTLDLFDCSNITDASVLEVARRCSNLQTLTLWGSSITDASVMEVARGCSNLQTLNLWDCSNITDASVLEVARRCSNLQTLDLAFCSNITDASVLEVARGCSNLQTLDLSFCRNITNASVMEVARRCSNLQTLDLQCCTNITSACKNALRQSHPKLELKS